MTPMNLIKVIGDVDESYVLSALETRDTHTKKKKRTSVGRSLLIAAIIALMLLLVGCCIIISMQLQQVVMDVPTFTNDLGEERQKISLQGLEGSNSFKASQEWQIFINSYDPDHSILYANNDFYLEEPDEYYSYGCYSWEMVDKAAEICEKYGLEPLGKPWDYRQPEHIFEAVGIETVFSGSGIIDGYPFSGYCYGDGTFKIEGCMELKEKWNVTTWYSLRSVQKTSFDNVISTIGDVEAYDQWEYTMKDGTKVLMALGKEGRIIVDKENCFVVLTAFGTLESIMAPVPQERAFLEAFCDAFNFDYQTQRVDPEKADALVREEKPTTYSAWIQYLLEERASECPNLMYALIDINNDGQEELLLRCDGLSASGQSDDNNLFFAIKSMKDGELIHLVDNGLLYLCKGNVIEAVSSLEGEEDRHDYYRYDEKQRYILVDQIIPKDGALYRYLGDESWEISNEEAEEVIAQYPRMDIEFKPAGSFDG